MELLYVYWLNLGHALRVIFVQLFEFGVSKGCNLYCGKSGWWYWPRSCNWSDPSWVKSTSSFFF